MKIDLLRISVDDAEKIWRMQTQAFSDLLKKYQDFDTSPANESVERIKEKLLQDYTYFYYIYANQHLVGDVRVVDKKDDSRKRVAPIFILPEFRHRGIAQRVFYEIEKIHGQKHWELNTILQEQGNCYLYEKLGYKRRGCMEKINDKMTVVYYVKE